MSLIRLQQKNSSGSLALMKSKKVVVYGESIDPSAGRIVWTLMYHGHPDVKLLDISFSQWQKSGFPVISEVIPAQRQKESKSSKWERCRSSSSIQVENKSTIRADADYIKTKQVDPNVVIIDARTPQEHFQARIPGSILDNWGKKG